MTVNQLVTEIKKNLEAIKEKYKNGVTMDILEEFADKIL